jgi:hypothetical protein
MLGTEIGTESATGSSPLCPHEANPLALLSWSHRRELPRLADTMGGLHVYILVLTTLS